MQIHVPGNAPIIQSWMQYPVYAPRNIHALPITKYNIDLARQIRKYANAKTFAEFVRFLTYMCVWNNTRVYTSYNDL